MPPVGFEPTVSEGERPQTYALDRAATGIGYMVVYARINHLTPNGHYMGRTTQLPSRCCI